MQPEDGRTDKHDLSFSLFFFAFMHQTYKKGNGTLHIECLQCSSLKQKELSSCGRLDIEDGEVRQRRKNISHRGSSLTYQLAKRKHGVRADQQRRSATMNDIVYHQVFAA
jgi:hypothetical protein